MNHTLSRTVLYFFAACFLAWSLFSPGGAMAASTTINDNSGGPYTGLYGNSGTATVPTDDTNASGNTLILGNGSTGPTIAGSSPMRVSGGQALGASSGSADSNTLTINSGTSLTGIDNDNTIFYGGRVAAGSGNANNNTVTIGGFTQGSGRVLVYGGLANGSGNASTNSVTINSGNSNIFDSIYGGYANSGNAVSNTVTINGGGQINSVVGGYSATGNAGGSGASNVVNISGGNANILNGILGGNSHSGFASYNEVNIGSGYTGIIDEDVAGGWVTSSNGGNAEHNSVTIAGGTLSSAADVIGGHSSNGAATSNTVTISGGTVGGDIRSGSTSSGSATDNTVTITTTGKTYLNIYGGYNMWSASGDLFTGNTLNLAAGNTVSSVQNMAILNFTSGGNAGIGTLDTTPTGAAGTPLVEMNTGTNNITFSGGITGSGGIDKIGTGTLTLSGTNTYSGGTTVSVGTLVGNIAANTDLTVAGGATYDGTGAARTVNALNGAGNITNGNGLTAQSGAFSGVISGAGSLTKTGAGTLTLNGANTYTGMTTVQGGVLELGASASLASNNLTLHGGSTFRNSGGGHSLNNGSLTVRGENATYDGNLSAISAILNFIAPVSVSQPLLKVTGTADISDSAVNVGVSGATALPKGTQLTLVQAAGGLTANNLTQGSGIAESGVTTIYGLSLEVDPLTGLLRGTVTSGRATEQSKALSEGFISGVALVNLGADLIAGQGMSDAVSSARRAAREGISTYGLGSFGALSGGWSRYNTGSHVDMSSLSLLAGLSWGRDFTPGRLTLGAFFEYGNGSYDTYNSFSNAASVHGDGDIYHIGGGVLGRMDFTDTGPGHFYAEASGRAGGVHNEYSSSDLRDASGRKADYDSSSAYYGLHLGAGYVWNITDKASLDFYGKYFWTRQEGDSVTLSTGDPVTFKDVDSSRLRLGGRFAYALNEYVSPYIGAAWEHEFDGKARATTKGYAIDAPSLRGDTGIGELGLSLKPSATLPLSFDLGVQGYVGRREGVTGSLQAKFEF